MKDSEALLAETLAQCQSAITTALAKADSSDPKAIYNRGVEIERAVSLLKASARVADSLARLRGQHIHVVREGHVTREGVPEKRGSITPPDPDEPEDGTPTGADAPRRGYLPEKMAAAPAKRACRER
jgi:hypothetical protein